MRRFTLRGSVLHRIKGEDRSDQFDWQTRCERGPSRVPALTMSRPPALLAGDSPRSEHDPELGATAADTIAMHPVTGAFADPLHESAFAAHLFRLAFPCHASLMVLLLGLTIWTAFGPPAELFAVLAWSVLVLILALGLVGRVLVHRMNDSVRGQRIGSWTWMAVVVLGYIADMCGFLKAPAVSCAQLSESAALLPLVYYAIALINASHGLGFVCKAALIGLVLVDCFSVIAVCNEAGLVLVFIAVVPMTIFGFTVAHVAEIHLRHSYAETQRLKDQKEKVDGEKRRLEERLEQLRGEMERLMYDVQRRGQPLDDGDDRSAIRRGLQSGPSQPYHRVDSTGSSEKGAPAPSDSPPASLPPGPPSSSASKSSKSSQSSKGSGKKSSQAANGKSAVPPPHWAPEVAYRQFHAEKAAGSTTEQGAPPKAPPQARPPIWAELDAEYYAEIAAKSATEPRTAPLTLVEADRHGPSSRASATATPAKPLSSRQAETHRHLDRRCTGVAVASATEQGREQLQSWQVSSDPVYVNAREKLAAAQALADIARQKNLAYSIPL